MAQLNQKFTRLMIRNYWIRKAFVALYNRTSTNPQQKSLNALNLQIDDAKIVEEVDANGFSNPFQLNPKLVDALIRDCQNEVCVPEENTELEYRIEVERPANPNPTYIKYMFKDSIKWQSVKDIIYNATVLKIAKDYLGNDPVIQNVSIWWSFPKPETMESNIYNFHYDIDNLKFIKLFTYLTKVDEDNGPHIIYPKTHKYKSMLQKRYRSVPDQKIPTVFGNAKPVVMVGDKGTSFFEDTFSYHKGLNPVRPRLIFQVEYSLTPDKLG